MSTRVLWLLSAVLLALVALMLARRPAATWVAPPTVDEPQPATGTSVRGPALPRLPAPQLPQIAGSNERALEAPATKTLARLLKGEEIPKLTRAQVEAYLQQNKRSAESLLAAARATGDLAWLREAAEKFPDDPRVQFDLALRGETPEEKRQALAAFRQLARDNPLGDYLSALDYFKSGHADDGVKDLMQAGGKTKLQDYTLDHMQSAEEAFLSAGRGPLEAKVAGIFGVVLPHLQSLRDLATQMTDLQKQYVQSGDAASAQAVGQMGLNLAWQLESQPGRTLIAELVGMAIEKKFLAAQTPESAFGNDGRTVRDRLAELDAHRQAIHSVVPVQDLIGSLPEREALLYFDRVKVNGELDALRWLKNKHGSP